MLKRTLILLILALALVAPVARAQDTEVPPTVESFPTVEQSPVTIEPTLTPEVVTATPTAEPTEQPAPIIADGVNFRLGIFGIIVAVGGLVLSGFGIGAIWGHIRASKEAKDAIEQAYEALSPAAQEQIRLAQDQVHVAWDRVSELVNQILEFTGQVTDGQSNTAEMVSKEVTRQVGNITHG